MLMSFNNSCTLPSYLTFLQIIIFDNNWNIQELCKTKSKFILIHVKIHQNCYLICYKSFVTYLEQIMIKTYLLYFYTASCLQHAAPVVLHLSVQLQLSVDLEAVILFQKFASQHLDSCCYGTPRLLNNRYSSLVMSLWTWLCALVMSTLC